jgi:hypothetical protein
MEILVVAKSKEKEARDGGVRMELTRKMGLVGFNVLWLGESGAWQGRRRLPEAKNLQLGQELQVGGANEGGWVHTEREPEAKMEIPVQLGGWWFMKFLRGSIAACTLLLLAVPPTFYFLGAVETEDTECSGTV